MEKHKCRLCFKSFANGRALGGHMRSHMLNLPLPPKVEEPTNQLIQDSNFTLASSSSSSEEGGGVEQSYGLRENPKRSVRLVDPEFVDAGSVVLQDRESETETESSKNPTRSRRRSKQTPNILEDEQQGGRKKLRVNNKDHNQVSRTDSWAEPEPMSSISHTTTEDVAFCLMMLSRDKWKSKVLHQDDGEEEEEETEMEIEIENYELQDFFKIKSRKFNRTSRGKYRCETCNKVFKSYQALGGHRASHKKMKAYSAGTHETELEPENVGAATSSMTDKKTHECPVCFRVFSSGQALGGHKRSHAITGHLATPVKSSKKLGDSFIDLNLPAPTDDDDATSQIELSAVSDAEFVNHIK